MCLAQIIRHLRAGRLSERSPGQRLRSLAGVPRPATERLIGVVFSTIGGVTILAPGNACMLYGSHCGLPVIRRR
ncbi:hypothetical protein RvVAT039_pl11710 (plasmid) [Agrobacterium vitis]|nr:MULTISPECIES: hypothetical protein [Rhizobium/Agrobacterium group]BCH68338.1 hypothetical protein RvVAT039_pl11710 [Agrobacterium vitis]